MTSTVTEPAVVDSPVAVPGRTGRADRSTRERVTSVPSSPALGEGRSVATALTALAQQPDAAATITRTLFVGLAMIESTAIYCFVVSMILIFANPFWNHFIAQAATK